METAQKELHIAIVYFGMPRSIPATWQSHRELLFENLKHAGVKFTTFAHFWKAKKYYVWEKEHAAPEAEDYKLLKPDVHCCEDQEEFLATLRFADYFYEPVWRARGDSRIGEWRPELIRNHLCALESQRRAFQIVKASGIKFDAVLLVRTDALLQEKFPIRFLKNVQSRSIYIPDFKHNEGYNDRMAFGDMESMGIYMCRIEGAAHYRATVGRIVSEKYLAHTLEKAHLTVVKFPYEFEFVRPPAPAPALPTKL